MSDCTVTTSKHLKPTDQVNMPGQVQHVKIAQKSYINGLGLWGPGFQSPLCHLNWMMSQTEREQQNGFPTQGQKNATCSITHSLGAAGTYLTDVIMLEEGEQAHFTAASDAFQNCDVAIPGVQLYQIVENVGHGFAG